MTRETGWLAAEGYLFAQMGEKSEPAIKSLISAAARLFCRALVSINSDVKASPVTGKKYREHHPKA